MKEKKILEDNIAKKYWREFERFVLEYLKAQYQITDESFAKLTPPSGGGH